MRVTRRICKVARFSALPALLCCSLVSQAGVVEEAEKLILGGNGEQAYALLSAEIDEHAGQPEFDYMLGIAALDAGKPAEAVFALERVLDLQPDNAEARAELARAYFQLGEGEAAKIEFESISQLSLPTDVQNTINKYLSAIEHQFDASRTRYETYLETGFGYDSNANSATDTADVAVPSLGNLLLTLDDVSLERDSAVWTLGGGFHFSAPHNASVNIFGGVDIDHRIPFHASNVDTRTAEGVFGVHALRGKHQYRLALQAQRFFIDGNTNRNLGGLSAQWQYAVDASDQLTTFIQLAAQRFPGQELRDVNSVTGGLAWGHAFEGHGAPVMFSSIYAGKDHELSATREDQGKQFGGLRIGGQYTLNTSTTTYANVNYQYSRYDADDPLFLRVRKEHFLSSSVGAIYQIDSNWSLKPELQYSYNDSTLPVNEYDRFEAMLTIRNTF